MKKIVVLTGAGISAESGISTFRDANGLWEGHDIMEVASPIGWNKNPDLVNTFYNKRRDELNRVTYNAAHKFIADLEDSFNVKVITQNVDDLHERAGSSQVIHLHGELRKVRSTGNPTYVKSWNNPLTKNDLCPDGYPLRPHIVWFGESVPMMDAAILEIGDAEIVIIIGTSMQVYPAASLTSYSSDTCPIIYLDPKPSINYELTQSSNLTVIEKKATEGILELSKILESYK